MTSLASLLQKAVAGAETLTGKKFSLLVASSLVATAGIVAVGVSGSGGLSPVTAAAMQALMEEEGTALTASPAPTPEYTPTSPEGASSAGAAPSGPLPAPAPAPEAAPAPEPETPVAPPTEEETGPASPVQHVFLISLASPGYEAAFGTSSQMPYLSAELRPQGALLTNYSLLETAPLSNGIATISGQPPNPATKENCASYKDFSSPSANSSGIVSGEGCIYPVETLTVADQLVGSRLRWHGYFEGMVDSEGKPDDCVQPEPEAADVPTATGYSSRLNPFVFFHSLLDLGDCSENDVPLDKLAGDLKKVDTTANLSYISPNLCNSGFRGTCPEGTTEGAAAADAFLAKVVPEIISSPAYKQDGLLIVSFGASDPAPADPAVTPPADPRKVGGLLVSPLLSPGATDGAAYNPYSLLRSIEDLFGLDPLGKAGGSKVKSFATAFTAGNGGD